jgi:hypothetical protein
MFSRCPDILPTTPPPGAGTKQQTRNIPTTAANRAASITVFMIES